MAPKRKAPNSDQAAAKKQKDEAALAEQKAELLGCALPAKLKLAKAPIPGPSKVVSVPGNGSCWLLAVLAQSYFKRAGEDVVSVLVTGQEVKGQDVLNPPSVDATTADQCADAALRNECVTLALKYVEDEPDLIRFLDDLEDKDEDSAADVSEDRLLWLGNALRLGSNTSDSDQTEPATEAQALRHLATLCTVWHRAQ